MCLKEIERKPIINPERERKNAFINFSSCLWINGEPSWLKETHTNMGKHVKPSEKESLSRLNPEPSCCDAMRHSNKPAYHLIGKFKNLV